MKRRARRFRPVGPALAAIVLAATACGPDVPAPTGPTWITTHVSRTVVGTTTTNYVGAWTDLDWASTLQVDTGAGGSGTASLLLFPRSGPGNSTLGSPQTITPTVSPALFGPIGGHVIGLPGTVNGNPAIEFFKRTAGTWGSAGLFNLPANQQVAAMTDAWLVTRDVPINAGVEAHVYLFPLDTSGPSVVVGSVTTLGPDPAWPLALREGFGGPGAAIDGDLLVVGAQGQFSPTPGGARVFRAAGSVWAPVLSLGASPTGPNNYARALAVDDGPTIDRIALGPQADGIPSVEVFADSGSGFTLEQTIVRDPGDPDEFQGLLFGNGLAIDGDLLAVTARAVLVPSAQVGHADVKVGYVQLFRKGATWAREAEVPVFTNPASPGTVSSLPFKLQAAGNHVAVFVFVTPDPPPGCTFPCFNFGVEAWSIDRTG